MKKLDDILEPIKMPDNIIIRPYTDVIDEDKSLLFIPNDGTYFKILGHKIETGEQFNTVEQISNWLKHIKDVEIENEQLKKQMSEIGKYILTKYEEAKLDAQYIDGVRYPNVQERIYEDILGRFELN